MTHEFFSFFHFSYNEWKRQQSIQKSQQQQQQPRHNQSHGNNYKPPAGGRSERLVFFYFILFSEKGICTFNGFGVLCLKGSTPTRQLLLKISHKYYNSSNNGYFSNLAEPDNQNQLF